jgi:2-hydroxymuconate-semialdehyde hydrolase
VSDLREFDVPFEGTTIHYWRGGKGHPLIFLHGSGPGVGTMSNFRRVLGPLSENFEVLAADLIGFGKSGRRPAEPYYDMDMWVREARFLIDTFPSQKVGLIGHSLSGSIVLKTASGNPRVAGVVTTGTTGTRPATLENGPRWIFPVSREEVRQNVERTMFNKLLASEEEIDNRFKVLTAPGYREYFESMFSNDRNYYLNQAVLSDAELAGIRCPTLLMHGANDASFKPEETSLALAARIQQADVFILGRCAHSVALEYPDKFITNVRQIFAGSSNAANA